MAKNIVILSDGTGNEPKLEGNTNVMRLFDLLPQDDTQVVWYDPGVGTKGSAKALTPLGRGAAKFAGLAFGYGLKENVTQAYRFLMETHQHGDRVFLFGFSRGAYTVRALAGLLYQVGLLRPGQDNLLPYALKLFWWNEGKKVDSEAWQEAQRFSNQFARPDFRRHEDRKIHHIGLWDTVKATGFVRRELLLPWTAKMPMAATLSHAVSIDEKRRPFKPNLLKYSAPGKKRGDFKEVWFAGVHSDVGGTFKDNHLLADITLHWIVADAIGRDLDVDQVAFKEFEDQAASAAEAPIHDMGWRWWITTILHRRKVLPDDAAVHESVAVRMARTKGREDEYRPRLPAKVRWEPWPHLP